MSTRTHLERLASLYLLLLAAAFVAIIVTRPTVVTVPHSHAVPTCTDWTDNGDGTPAYEVTVTCEGAK